MRLGFGVLLCWIVSLAPASARTYHYSSWSDNAKPYIQAIEESRQGPTRGPAPSVNVRAGIVTHHFLASGLMVRFFESLRAGASPDTIILMGPNHFHHGNQKISLSSLPWKTPFGVVEADPEITRTIEAATHTSEDPEAFTGEHSVGVLMPLLRYYFPRARVVPLLIDSRAEDYQLKALQNVLDRSLADPKVLVLLSMDFSHDSTAEIADTRDKKAEQVILSLNQGGVGGLDVDCRKGLWVLLSAVRHLGEVKIRVLEHTSSAYLSHNPGQSNATSYFTVLFTRPTRKARPPSP